MELESKPQYSTQTKVLSCLVLLFFSVSATILAEASKGPDGVYPYDAFAVPLCAEIIKLGFSLSLSVPFVSKRKESSFPFIYYALPAFCYFVSNNCMLFIIRELGPTTFQITNNLKTFSTAVLMRLVLSKHLSWQQIKALVLLVCGSIITQLCEKEEDVSPRQSELFAGVAFVVINAVASGLGGVFSEKLLKGKTVGSEQSIHVQNSQLYLFGVLFGSLSLFSRSKSNSETSHLLHGFNLAAYATVVALAINGILVSFVLKYLDNIAKCFVGAFTMIIVGTIQSLVSSETISMHSAIGIILTCLALELYHCQEAR